ncbi:hypothetical protein [Pseudovibrio exalbescens]|uniref:hypothetical protein n=1 Tax=Pseudovibrio exalbescens TaxID=197461 RepID=UPI001F1767E8|nr:hypothetical protein [Pseudovibrio exalbescens]
MPRDGRGAPRKTRIAGDREAIIGHVIEGRYLKRQKARPSEIVRAVLVECRKAGISPPSEATIRRRVNLIDKGVASRLRADDPGTKPILGATPIPKYPIDVVQIDHTPVDVILVDPFERLPIGRPYLTVAIDVMSRMGARYSQVRLLFETNRLSDRRIVSWVQNTAILHLMSAARSNAGARQMCRRAGWRGYSDDTARRFSGS